MDKISAKHYIVFIISSTIISLLTYSSIFINLGGRDTWLCVLSAFILLILFALLLMNIACKCDNYNINEIFIYGLSKPIGEFFLFLFALGLFISSVESVAVEANAIKTNYFLETPAWYIILFFIFPSFFLLGKKLKTIVIFLIVNVATLVVNAIVLSLITEKYREIELILPVLGNGISTSMVQGTILILGSISSFAITLPYLRYVTKDSKVKLHTLICLAIITLFATYSIIGTISTFGPLRAANLFYPLFTQSQRVEIGGFLEFGEFFFLIQTIIGLFIKYLLCSYGIYIIYNKKIKSHKAYITIYSIFVFIFATLLAGNNYTLFTILKYYSWLNLFFFIFIPLLTFICFYIRKPNDIRK